MIIDGRYCKTTIKPATAKINWRCGRLAAVNSTFPAMVERIIVIPKMVSTATRAQKEKVKVLPGRCAHGQFFSAMNIILFFSVGRLYGNIGD